MLSISPPLRGAGKGDYYLNLAREDYYLEGGEPLGKWRGRGAEALGLSGTVERDQLRAMLDGYDPATGEELVRNAGAENRQSAWDLTFSAPKSVSALWSQADQGTRQEIQKAHDSAVGRAIQYLDESAGFTRRGEAGREREEGKLVFATFEHGTSRAQDPQLHTHALVLNVSVREDGTTGTIESRELYQSKMAAGALYRAELAAQLERRLGVETERKNSWFEVKGVDQGLIDEFSKRRAEIEKKLSARGLSSQRAGDIATLDTREGKEHRPREELFREWQEIGRARGWSTDQVDELRSRGARERNPEQERAAAVDKALTKLTAHQSHFSEREFVRQVAEEAQGRGLSADDSIRTVRSQLEGNSEIVRLGERTGETRYTTKEMLELEKRMLDQVERGKGTAQTAKRETLEGVLSDREFLSAEQRAAVEHVTVKPGRIAAVSGMAGTGKSTMLEAARNVWERDSYEVIGAAISGKAAQGLEEGSGIKSDTLHKTLSDFRAGKRQLSGKSIVVIDEAGMVGTRQMAELVAVTDRAGAKLVLVGDAKQLQPIDAGGPFKAIAERVGEARLKEIRRQREDWARAAVKDFAAGNADQALARYAERGLVTVSQNREHALSDLVDSWRANGGAGAPEKHLILAGANHEVRALNARAQQERYNAGELGERSTRVDRETVFEGDRIVFTRNSRLYGVKNGQLGTVSQIDPERNMLAATLDDGRRVSVPLERYEHVKLGYAVTTHKSQGVTVENAYILAGGGMQDRELSYVQASRARGQSRFFVDRLEAGEQLKDLSRQMRKSHQKDLAVSVSQPEISQGRSLDVS